MPCRLWRLRGSVPFRFELLSCRFSFAVGSKAQEPALRQRSFRLNLTHREGGPLSGLLPGTAAGILAPPAGARGRFASDVAPYPPAPGNPPAAP
jgi:hypothetical protein